jgi:NTE family protein
MKLAVVLGAGGLVGIAHHVGVLHALSDELGLVADDADLLVGTSAGSAVAAYLRSGWTTSALIDRAADLSAAAPASLSGSPVDFLRHGIGSAYILARATIRVPSLLSLPPLPLLRRAFPAGLVNHHDSMGILEAELPRRWPVKDLYLAAYDLQSRRRVVLGRPGAPYLPLPTAVRASCAIPGFYPPVQAGGGILVDGGASSLTNLDLAAIAGCDTVICIAPVAYDPARPPERRDRLVREVPTRALMRQAERLRRQGIRVIVLVPGPLEVAVHGVNLMRGTGLEQVATIAYDETLEQVRHGLLGGQLAAVAA